LTIQKKFVDLDGPCVLIGPFGIDFFENIVEEYAFIKN